MRLNLLFIFVTLFAATAFATSDDSNCYDYQMEKNASQLLEKGYALSGALTYKIKYAQFGNHYYWKDVTAKKFVNSSNHLVLATCRGIHDQYIILGTKNIEGLWTKKNYVYDWKMKQTLNWTVSDYTLDELGEERLYVRVKFRLPMPVHLHTEREPAGYSCSGSAYDWTCSYFDDTKVFTRQGDSWTTANIQFNLTPAGEFTSVSVNGIEYEFKKGEQNERLKVITIKDTPNNDDIVIEPSSVIEFTPGEDVKIKIINKSSYIIRFQGTAIAAGELSDHSGNKPDSVILDTTAPSTIFLLLPWAEGSTSKAGKKALALKYSSAK